MRTMKGFRKDNSGLSLVEFVIALAILSIVSAAVFEFVIVASKHYRKESNEVELQYEAQLAMNQLQDLLIDVTKGVSYSVNGSADLILKDDETAAGSVASKQLMIYNADAYYIVEWIAGEQRLFYTEYKRDGDDSWNLVVEDALMAEYVSSFSVDLSQVERSNSIRLEVLFENEGDYKVMQNVTIRNSVSVNKTRSQMYDS